MAYILLDLRAWSWTITCPPRVFAYHGSGAKGVTGEVSPHVPAREPLPNFSRKLILHFPESGRVPSDEVTWLVPRL